MVFGKTFVDFQTLSKQFLIPIPLPKINVWSELDKSRFSSEDANRSGHGQTDIF